MRSRELVPIVLLAAFFGLVCVGAFAESQVMMAIGVMCLGAVGLMSAIQGRPTHAPSAFMLFERFLYRSPEWTWRLVNGLMGAGISLFGLWGFFDAMR